MQPLRVSIEINPRDIPALICSGSSESNPYTAMLSRKIAESLGLEDYLDCPERMYELVRVLWEKDQRFELEAVSNSG